MSLRLALFACILSGSAFAQTVTPLPPEAVPPPGTQAATRCLPMEEMLKQLEERFHETVVVMTGTFQGLPLVMVANPLTGTFSAIVTDPNTDNLMTCIQFYGENISSVKFHWGAEL